MSKVDDFMRQLHQQASGGDDARKKQDRAIMRIFGSWIEKRTQEYLKATDNGESDAEYLGEKPKRACVDYETAREMTRKILGKRYDPESIDECMMPEFDAAYEDADEEEWWRQKYFGNVGKGCLLQVPVMGPAFLLQCLEIIRFFDLGIVWGPLD